jgi:hypothetical protein
MFFRVATLVAMLALSGCIGGKERQRSEPRAKVDRPTLRSPETRQCMADLGRAGVRFEALDDRWFSSGCSALGSVKLLDVGVPITNLGAMTCPLARTFAQWISYGVRPAGRVWLGGEVVKVETMGTYSCRNVAGTGRRSEHASANAVDVSAFVMADGRRITIKGDWNSPDRGTRQFLRAVHQSACRRFGTILSPDYNAAHHDHLHFDMGPGPFCR